MVSSILLMAVMVFSIRGFFLGFPRVIARLLGFICAYIASLVGRQPLAELLVEKQLIEISPLILQVLSGAVLFFGTLFLVTLLVTSLFKMAAKIIPGLSELVDKDSPGSRVFGAGTNAMIGAACVLIGLWGYNLFTDKAPETRLDHIANNLGTNLLAFASQSVGAKPDSRPSSKPQARPTDQITEQAINSTTEDSDTQASIQQQLLSVVSAMSQNKTLSDSAGTADNHGDGPIGTLNIAELNELLDNPNIKQLLADPALRKMALENMQDNPQQLMDALNNPDFRNLLNQQPQGEL